MKIHVVELPLFFSFCPCVDGVSSTLVQGWTCDIDPDENKHSMPTDWASQVVLVVKNPFANTRDRRDASWIPGLGRSPGGGHGNLLQYSCLENPHGQRSLAGCSPRGHSWAPKHHTAHHCLYANYRHPPVAHWVKHLPAMQEPQETQVWSQHPEDPLEEEMATHSSILGWRILWTEEPGALQSMGSQRAGHDKSTRPCVWLLHFSSSVKQFKKQ